MFDRFADEQFKEFQEPNPIHQFTSVMPEADSYANAFYSVAPSNAVVFHSTGAFNYNELYFITFAMATKLRENLQLLFDDNKE